MYILISYKKLNQAPAVKEAKFLDVTLHYYSSGLMRVKRSSRNIEYRNWMLGSFYSRMYDSNNSNIFTNTCAVKLSNKYYS